MPVPFYRFDGQSSARFLLDAAWPIVAISAVCLFGMVILLLSGADPAAAAIAMAEGAFGSREAVYRTLEKAIPLIFSGLAVAWAFKAGLFNIGVQGQFLFGALAAGFLGFSLEGAPAWCHVPAALSAGALAGACYAAFKGFLKAYAGAHEVITGIMLNYIAINLTDYLASGPLKDTANGNILARTPSVLDTAILHPLAGIPSGMVLAAACAIMVWIVLRQTTLGFEIATVGINPDAARYGGIGIGRTLFVTMAVSGALGGLGGGVETLGVVHRFQPGFNGKLGFDGITIALLAKTNPFGVVPAAVLVGAMRAGAAQMQFDAEVAPEIIDILLALVLFLAAANQGIIKWFGFRGYDGKAPALTSGWGKQR